MGNLPILAIFTQPFPQETASLRLAAQTFVNFRSFCHSETGSQAGRENPFPQKGITDCHAPAALAMTGGM